MGETRPEPEHFVPSGAIAFFAVMVVCYLAIWFGMYALLVARG